MDAFGLPMDADPSRDRVVGYDEFGRPVLAGRLGTRYIQGAAPTQRNSLAGTPLSLADVMATSGGARGAGQPRQTSRLAPANAPEPSWGPLGGLANMLLEGLQAPGNALAGRPVTLGEVWGTAGTAALGGTAVPRPANALGANSFRAYHGSPHSFDKFSMDKIGTGEGRQAEGAGLYFADREDVASWYRDGLSDKIGDGRSGTMYEVNINADPNDFVDWSSPLSGQPAAVRDWFSNRGVSEGFAGQQSGAELLMAERGAMGDLEVAQSMKEAGIPGIRYPDRRTRGTGERTHNYVVFDDKLIDIVRKYGWVAAAPMLAQMGLTPEQAQAQYEAQN